MKLEDQKKEIETIKGRSLVLNLSDADCKRILEKAASAGMTVSELLEHFIGDLVEGTYTDGSDERYLAQDWFDRCGFRQMADRTLLRHLLNEGYDLSDFLTAYEESEEDNAQHIELEDWKPRDGVELRQEIEIIRNFLDQQDKLLD